MTSLIVTLGKVKPQAVLIDEDIPSLADRYSRKDGTFIHFHEDIFFDLLEDQNGTICGLEIHVDEHHLFKSESVHRPYVICNPFPTIMFSQPTHSNGKGLEALGDVVLVLNFDHDPILCVSVDWLSEGDGEAVKTLLN
jgi:hypothetical protein